MSNFEFVFSLLVILLGLGLGQVLGGLASAVKRRPELSIGWGTGLLGTWVMAETVIFWMIVWRTRDVLPDDVPSLYAGFAITALYYFAGALVFPDNLDEYSCSSGSPVSQAGSARQIPDDLANRKSLDDYFMATKAKVIGAVIAAFTISFLLRPLILANSWSFLNWLDWASMGIIYLAGAVVMFTRRRGVAVTGLAVLVALDLFTPFGYLLLGE